MFRDISNSGLEIMNQVQLMVDLGIAPILVSYI